MRAVRAVYRGCHRYAHRKRMPHNRSFESVPESQKLSLKREGGIEGDISGFFPSKRVTRSKKRLVDKEKGSRHHTHVPRVPKHGI